MHVDKQKIKKDFIENNKELAILASEMFHLKKQLRSAKAVHDAKYRKYVTQMRVLMKDCCTPREQKILIMRHKLNLKGFNFSEIGSRMQMSRARAQQIEKGAIKKIMNCNVW